MKKTKLRRKIETVLLMVLLALILILYLPVIVLALVFGGRKSPIVQATLETLKEERTLFEDLLGKTYYRY